MLQYDLTPREMPHLLNYDSSSYLHTSAEASPENPPVDWHSPPATSETKDNLDLSHVSTF